MHDVILVFPDGGRVEIKMPYVPERGNKIEITNSTSVGSEKLYDIALYRVISFETTIFNNEYVSTRVYLVPFSVQVEKPINE